MPIECSLGEALRLFEEHLSQAGVTQNALTVYTRALHGPFTSMILCQLPEDRRGLPIQSLPVSQIPQSLIHDCMRLSRPFSFRIGRRFLTFLIHAGCLDGSLLPRRSTVLLQAIERASTEPDAHLSLPQAVILYIKHLSEHSSLLAGALKNNPTDGFRVKKPKIQPPSALEEKQLTAILAATCPTD